MADPVSWSCRPASEATYLAWLDCRDPCRDLGLGDDPAATFLDRGRVAVNSGPTFAPGGAGHPRLDLATSPDLITEAVHRMAAAVRPSSGAERACATP
ncbi:hypothetical protein LWC33_14760 [Pseudonocardia sp. RS11V-5]|uniref:hypothetical protein n=1 Tax=Pseudonocardia terrae TaxID=2905831 RepID=UPI001E57AA69|nr:hypothetical protein [Pseudonocardia terrae]MCE3552715.1 hypothetical protein [Pseudonocardia terrae]